MGRTICGEPQSCAYPVGAMRRAKIPVPTEHEEQKMCACGCGLPTPIAPRTDAAKGWVRGEPLRYLRHHHKRPKTKGRRDGYGHRIVRGHPRANPAGQVLEHMLVVEAALGHPLPPKAQVHHANGVRSDNRHGNLVACEDHAYHMLLHRRQRALAACGDPTWLPCARCKEYDAPERLVYHGKGSVVHPRCRDAYKCQWTQKHAQSNLPD